MNNMECCHIVDRKHHLLAVKEVDTRILSPIQTYDRSRYIMAYELPDYLAGVGNKYFIAMQNNLTSHENKGWEGYK